MKLYTITHILDDSGYDSSVLMGIVDSLEKAEKYKKLLEERYPSDGIYIDTYTLNKVRKELWEKNYFEC